MRITSQELEAQVRANVEKPVKGVILALKIQPSETTKGGVIKGESIVKEEAKNANNSYVFAIHPESTVDFKIGDIVNDMQGIRDKSIPSYVDGYDVVVIREHNVLTYREFDGDKE